MPRTLDATVNYSSIEIPIGIRHYFYLNKKSSLFLNGSFIFDIAYEGSTLIFPETPASNIDLKTGNGFYLGGGYNMNKKLSAELRYGFPRTLTNRLSWFSDYQKVSLIVGYNLF